MKKKRRKAFWSNIKFKYRLTITNENTLEDIITLRVSKLNGLSVLLSVLFVLFLIASLIVAFNPTAQLTCPGIYEQWKSVPR